MHERPRSRQAVGQNRLTRPAAGAGYRLSAGYEVEQHRAKIGQPWRDVARTVFLRTAMDEVVRPKGCHDRRRPQAHATTFDAEARGSYRPVSTRVRM